MLQARQGVDAIKAQLEKLTDAMLASTSEGTPLVFARRARQLENELASAEKKLSDSERELSHQARIDITGVDAKWRALAAGVEAQEIEPRLQARQLIADTFERITVYQKGMRPAAGDGRIDIVLLARSGQSRLLRIDRTGNWVAGEDVDLIG